MTGDDPGARDQLADPQVRDVRRSMEHEHHAEGGALQLQNVLLYRFMCFVYALFFLITTGCSSGWVATRHEQCSASWSSSSSFP
jgi:hypothetical protein